MNMSPNVTKNSLANLKLIWAILQFRVKRKTLILIIGQFSLSILDLIGIFLFGLIGNIIAQNPNEADTSYNFLPFENTLTISEWSSKYQLLTYVVLTFLLFILKSVFAYFLTRELVSTLSNESSKFSMEFVSKVLTTGYEKEENKRIQELIYLIEEGSRKMFLGIFANYMMIFTDVFLIIIIFIALLKVEATIALFTAFIILILSVFLQKRINRKTSLQGARYHKLAIDQNHYLSDLFLVRDEIFIRSSHEYFLEIMRIRKQDMARINTWLLIQPQLNKYFTEIFVIGFILFVVLFQLITNDFTDALPTIGIFLISSTRLAPAALRIQQSFTSIKSNSASVRKTFEMFNKYEKYNLSFSKKHYTDGDKYGNARTNKMDLTEIELRGINFSYGLDGKLAIENLNCIFSQGQNVAVIGPSGSGKSTFIKIVAGLLRPTSGDLLFSGANGTFLSRNLEIGIAYVPQNVHVITGTIKENILLGIKASEISENDLFEVLRIVQLDTFIRKLPHGVETLLGSGHQLLSGGQTQRIGIARALITKPSILILDEATNSIDSNMESEILFGIRNYLLKSANNAIIFHVTHRLSSLNQFDKILYLKDGKLLSMGNYDEMSKLLTELGHYY